MSRLWILIPLALFAAAMLAMKLWVAPWISSYGFTGLMIFLAVLTAFGYWVDKREGKVRSGYWKGWWIGPVLLSLLFGGIYLLDDRNDRTPVLIFLAVFGAGWVFYNWREVKKERDDGR